MAFAFFFPAVAILLHVAVGIHGVDRICSTPSGLPENGGRINPTLRRATKAPA